MATKVGFIEFSAADVDGVQPISLSALADYFDRHGEMEAGPLRIDFEMGHRLDN